MRLPTLLSSAHEFGPAVIPVLPWSTKLVLFHTEKPLEGSESGEMIQSLKFESGYPVRIDGIGRRRHRFGDRINVLFGPNGGGKTTMLHTLAVATGCGAGGWSGSDGEPMNGGTEAVPHGNETHDRGKPEDRGGPAERSDGKAVTTLEYRVTLEWDGRPVFYQDCYTHSEESFIGSGYLESREMLRSTGERRIGLINELIDYLEDRFLTYKLKPSERPTLLLDEVDNHIGFAGQAVLWKDIFPRLSKKYQLIISTHSIFPILLQKERTFRKDIIIELNPRYLEHCLQELGDAIEFFNTGATQASAVLRARPSAADRSSGSRSCAKQ